jgi:hypothetical protein
LFGWPCEPDIFVGQDGYQSVDSSLYHE